MISQEIRKIAPEMDPLRLGMGWTVEDLDKPQILVESTFGDSHPGSAHLLGLAEQAAAGAAQQGGRAARYFATDICDGMAQGHDGINYSLASRDTIANLISTGCDMGVRNLNKYLNEYQNACDRAKSLVKKVIRLEEDLSVDMRAYL